MKTKKAFGFMGKVRFPLILLFVLMVPILTDQWLSMGVKSFFYSLSLSIKTLLVFVLPFIVFSFIAACIARMGKNALRFTLLLIVTVFCSNILAIFTGYSIASMTLPWLSMPPAAVISSDASSLDPLWVFRLPLVFTNMQALIAGFIIGMLINILNIHLMRGMVFKASDLSSLFLKRCFIPILPFFIVGFAFKLHADGILKQAISAYGPILLLVIISQLSYLFVYFVIASKFSVSNFLRYIANTLPVTLTGLSTVSSAATMPVLIERTEQNIKDVAMAQTIIPAVINIHTIGSAIGLTILSMVTLYTFNLPLPSFLSFAIFAFCYALAKFSVAAVPGGVILVVGPILQSHLGFTDDMLGLITAIYMIFDPFGTAINVSGNSAFAIMLNGICQKLGLNKALQNAMDEQERASSPANA